jgi:hypothetical protein
MEAVVTEGQVCHQNGRIEEATKEATEEAMLEARRHLAMYQRARRLLRMDSRVISRITLHRDHK